MLELSRTVRFCLNDSAPGRAGGPSGGPSGGAKHNTFSAWPAMRGLGRFYQLRVTCRGEADPVTGYFLNIKAVDRVVRDYCLPHLARVLHNRRGKEVPLGRLMADLAGLLRRPLRGKLYSIALELTPFYSLEIRSADMPQVILRQRFEFSAAHRLHVPGLSAARNRAIFGKCNNPSGHGHNYNLEVAVRIPINPAGGVMPVAALDRLVDRLVIKKLDHKHLNLDVPAFARLNPSVENIAAVIYGMLDRPLRRAGAELEEVSVWETSKTVCTYRGEEEKNRTAGKQPFGPELTAEGDSTK